MLQPQANCSLRKVVPAIFTTWLLAAISAVGLSAERNSSFHAALESIRAIDLSRHVDQLAGDEMEGRESGSRGGRRAGDYLAQELARIGLHGGGADGGYFQSFPPNFRNVLAWIEGSDPALKDETVIVGAHYDHVGYGTRRNSRGPIGHIHYGADDNASGTSALLEVAEALAMLPQAPPRSVLLIFFDAEEKGLLGSRYWVAHPTIPRERIVAVVNVDMIGRVRQERLEVLGSRSASGLRRLICEQNDLVGLRLEFPWRLKDQGDHYPFYEAGIPAITLHSGLHNDYHTPRDTADKLNPSGMSEASRLMFAIVCELATRPQRLEVRPSAHRETDAMRTAIEQRPPQLVNRLGIGWDEDSRSKDGVRVTQVLANSAAAEAGLRVGDRIVAIGEDSIHSPEELRGSVCTSPRETAVTVRRTGEPEPLALPLQLSGEPMRLGLTWRVDDAEPGAVIVSYVVPHTPAAAAGLHSGDRVLQADGQDCATDRDFAEAVRAAGESIELLIEREGRLQSIIVEFQPVAAELRRAA